MAITVQSYEEEFTIHNPALKIRPKEPRKEHFATGFAPPEKIRLPAGGSESGRQGEVYAAKADTRGTPAHRDRTDQGNVAAKKDVRRRGKRREESAAGQCRSGGDFTARRCRSGIMSRWRQYRGGEGGRDETRPRRGTQQPARTGYTTARTDGIRDYRFSGTAWATIVSVSARMIEPLT